MWRRGVGKGAGAVGAAMGLAGLLTVAYGRYKGAEGSEEMRIERIKAAAMLKSNYMGVKREKEAEAVLEKLKETIVVLYHPTISGKSHLAAYIQAISSRPVLYLVSKDSLEATLQQFDPADTPYPPGSFQSFQSSLASALSSTSNPLLIIDSPENMPPLLSQKLILMANRLKRASKADALVVSSSIETVETAEACGELQVHVPSSLSKAEYMQIAEGMGVADSTAEETYQQWGDSLEVLVRSKEQQDYADRLLTSYFTDIRTILEARPDLNQPFLRAYETVTSLNPLGNIYSGSEAAKILSKAGLMVPFPNKSLHFRSKIAVSALHKALNS
jgi:hypothetical protein